VRLAATFARSSFARFINSPAGRVIRLVAGIGLIGWGYTHRGSGPSLALMVVGLIPLATGAFDLCLISALLGGPIRGAQVRSPGSDSGA